jgi:hypothetical protein
VTRTTIEALAAVFAVSAVSAPIVPPPMTAEAFVVAVSATVRMISVKTTDVAPAVTDSAAWAYRTPETVTAPEAVAVRVDGAVRRGATLALADAVLASVPDTSEARFELIIGDAVADDVSAVRRSSCVEIVPEAAAVARSPLLPVTTVTI